MTMGRQKPGPCLSCPLAPAHWPLIPAAALALLVMLLLLPAAQAVAQGREAPLRVMRSATLGRPLLVLPSGASAPAEVYADGVRFRLAVAGGFRVYEAFHDGVTRTLYVPLDAALRYVAFDAARNRFEQLLPALRVELEAVDVLDEMIAAAGGTGGKAYPALGFAVVHLPPQADPVGAADALEVVPDVFDVRLMTIGEIRVPN